MEFFTPRALQCLAMNLSMERLQFTHLFVSRVSIFGNFCFRANCAVCGAKFFFARNSAFFAAWYANPFARFCAFLRANFAAQNKILRSAANFARFCAQILRRKTKFLWRGGKFFFAGRKNIIFLLDAKVNIFAGSKSKSFCGHKIRHSIKPYWHLKQWHIDLSYSLQVKMLLKSFVTICRHRDPIHLYW